MKAIIIGASLSGKTTLIRYLRTKISVPISEMDEKLTISNDGIFPQDENHKKNFLAPQIIEEILQEEEILFFTNTDYFSDEILISAHEKGFLVIQLNLDLEALLKRNAVRVKKEGYSDQSQWLAGMIKYQEHIQKHGLVDRVIEADQSTEEIAQELLEIFA